MCASHCVDWSEGLQLPDPNSPVDLPEIRMPVVMQTEKN